MFLFWYEHRELLSAIVRSNMMGLTLEQFMETGYAERLGKRLVNLPELEDDSKMFRMTTFFTTSGLFVILLDWLRRGCEESPKEMAAMTVQLLTRPLYRALP